MKARQYRWVKGLKVGDILKIRTASEIKKEFGEIEIKDFEYIPKNTMFTVDLATVQEIEAVNEKRGELYQDIRIGYLVIDNGGEAKFIPIYIWMVKPYKLLTNANPAPKAKVNNANNETIPPKEEPRENLDEKDEIIKEMIGKVDKEKLYQLIRNYIGVYDIDKDIVDEYLNTWAHSKYKLYVNFGRTLIVEEHVNEQISSDSMRELISGLCARYPKYSVLLSMISPGDYIFNKVYERTYSMIKNASGGAMANYVKSGMKLSKFLSTLLQDDVFDIELSKILQNKTVTGITALSIDPCDYLSMSLTKNKWSSCYNIITGCYKNGPLSAMLDKCIVIGYKRSDIVYDFDYKFPYKDYSKQSRVYMGWNEDTGETFCSVSQGSMSEKVVDRLNTIFIAATSKACGLTPEDFKKYTGYEFRIKQLDKRSHFKDGIQCFYIRRNNPNITFECGVKNIKCPVCGKLMPNTSEYLCEHK